MKERGKGTRGGEGEYNICIAVCRGRMAIRRCVGQSCSPTLFTCAGTDKRRLQVRRRKCTSDEQKPSCRCPRPSAGFRTATVLLLMYHDEENDNGRYYISFTLVGWLHYTNIRFLLTSAEYENLFVMRY